MHVKSLIRMLAMLGLAAGLWSATPAARAEKPSDRDAAAASADTQAGTQVSIRHGMGQLWRETGLSGFLQRESPAGAESWCGLPGPAPS